MVSDRPNFSRVRFFSLRRIPIATLALTMILGGCSHHSDIPMGEAALPPVTQGPRPIPVTLHDYLLGPLDVIAVNVFREPDLTVAEAPISLSGKVSMPLLGELPVTGRSTQQVADQIRASLNARYLRNASVSVSVVRAANFTVTIDGQVNKPGVYQIPGARLTLLQAIALGEGTAKFAKLDEVVIIREFEGKRYAARFDLAAIREAKAPDPQIQQSDVIVVGFSNAASLFATAVSILPIAAGLFVAINQ
jgi:polysaccharide export outer membrane protein